MEYTAEHIDTQKFEDGLQDHRNFQMREQQITIEKARSFFEGYEKATEDVRSMLHCCNYESAEKRSAAFCEGVNRFIYELCKELDISGHDIRGMDTGTDEKASLLAERIREALCSTESEEADHGTD